MLVASANLKPGDLRGKTIAVPGRHTTALLLLRLFDPTLENFLVMPFNEIMDAVLEGNADAGLIIHESRFTYQGYGLRKLVDLGEWWETETGLPIPLGGIVAGAHWGRKPSRPWSRLCVTEWTMPAHIRNRLPGIFVNIPAS